MLKRVVGALLEHNTNGLGAIKGPLFESCVECQQPEQYEWVPSLIDRKARVSRRTDAYWFGRKECDNDVKETWTMCGSL